MRALILKLDLKVSFVGSLPNLVQQILPRLFTNANHGRTFITSRWNILEHV
nr:MAG TPA: hypothetical protein [Bacteriophage sp.]